MKSCGSWRKRELDAACIIRFRSTGRKLMRTWDINRVRSRSRKRRPRSSFHCRCFLNSRPDKSISSQKSLKESIAVGALS